MKGYFITSTDTNVGKTTVALCLMKHFKSLGKTVGCMKPVSAGCETTPEGLRNEDAIRLISQASIDLPYDRVNPYAFQPPIAPHIAAQQRGEYIDTKLILDRYREIAATSDLVIVEGAGGWLVPINHNQTMADIAVTLDLPVILVVGLRLGCLNHALLTANSIIQSGVPLAGWIANYIDRDMLNQKENVESLRSRINAPLIGTLIYNDNPALLKCNFEAELPAG